MSAVDRWAREDREALIANLRGRVRTLQVVSLILVAVVALQAVTR